VQAPAPGPGPTPNPRRLAAIAAGGAVAGIALVALAARGCRASRAGDLEQRVERIEDLLGLVDAGRSVAQASSVAAEAAGAAPVSADDRAAECAIAKVAAYKAWHEALQKAKALATAAETQCTDAWSDRRKQACYYAATAEVRAAQSARDAVMLGPSAAREAVKGVKDDPKNDAIAAARAASDKLAPSCPDDGG
jgi:hypothetical protein